MANSLKSKRLSNRRRKPKPARVWTGAFKTTAQANGFESQRGYGPPRRKWDPISPQEREQRATDALANHSLHIPHPKLPA